MQNRPSDRRAQLSQLIDALIEDSVVDAEQARTFKGLVSNQELAQSNPLSLIAARRWSSPRRPGSTIGLEELTLWAAEHFALPYLRIDPLSVQVGEITKVMAYGYAANFNIVAVEVRPSEVVIATGAPWNTEWRSQLEQILNKSISIVVANPDDIARYLLEFYSLSRSVFGAEKQRREGLNSALSSLEQLMELGRQGKLDANDQHVVNIVDWLLQYAFEQRASDIHLEPRRDEGKVRFRIDGVMHQVYEIPSEALAAVTSRIKILGRMDLAEKRRPQDGRLKTRNPDGKELELRLSTMPTAFGEKLVMRIFDPEVLVRDFSALGFAPNELKHWRKLMERPNGIVLVTGPTGSGKTTTLYSTLKELARPEVNVCTVEDPIEMVEPSFNQMQVQQNIDLTFATGVRTLLRQDPDIIMVGEIRDLETAEMAVQAALTGHLVFSTLHTNDASSAITRLLDIGVPYYLIRATLLGVLAQRLVRTLCPNCKRVTPIREESWQALVSPWSAAVPERACMPKGCLECRNTGYLGRVGLYEMLLMNPAVRSTITADCDLEQLRHTALKEGMRPLRLSGAQKVAAGLTTIEEVMRVAPPVGIERVE